MGLGMGMSLWDWVGMKTPHFLISKSASPGTSADSDTVDCYSPPAKKRRVFDFKDLCDPEDDQQQSRNELAEYVNLDGNGSGREWE